MLASEDEQIEEAEDLSREFAKQRRELFLDTGCGQRRCWVYVWEHLTSVPVPTHILGLGSNVYLD